MELSRVSLTRNDPVGGIAWPAPKTPPHGSFGYRPSLNLSYGKSVSVVKPLGHHS